MEQWVVSGYPITIILSAKIWSHWLFNTLVILLLCPFLALLFSLTYQELLILVTVLFLGTPSLFYICALASAFSIGLRQRGMFMALILFPLTLPILIFGSGTLNTARQGLPVSGHFALLLALSILCIVFLPFAIASVVRESIVDH